uniref:Ubiquitin-like domain-containing protein n=1 Tax=Macrostomum lignano TaxID=282301 RepID=A0A1I8HB62_9PLAT
MSIITITVKCDLDNDEIFGRVHVQTTADRTLDWLLDEFCTEKRVKRKETFALRRNAANPELDLAKTIAESGLTDGETIFAYNKNPPPPPPDLPKVPPPALSTWWILAALALAIGAIGLIVLVVVHLTLIRGHRGRGAHSTKAYIYAWRSSKYRGNGVVLQKATAHTSLPIQVAGGLSQMREAVSAVRPAVPEKLEKQTKLYLGATAGMRMYRSVNASKAEAVLSDARKILRPGGSGGFHFEVGGVRILEGDEEARAGWLAVNFLKGGFGDLPAREAAQNAGSTANPPPDLPATFGSLDLGDGSVQVAFESPPDSPPDSPDTRPLTVYGRTRRVYAHSFGCYGLGAAQRRAIGRAIADAGYDDGKPVDFPCWQLGTRQRGVRPPCSDGLFTVPAAKVDARFLVSGSGDASRCRLLAARFFNSLCNQTSCSFNNVYQPDPVGKFVAFSGFYHVADFFNLTANRRAASRPSANLTEVSILVDSFCSRSYRPSGSVSEARLRWLCFDGIFVESLLRGLGFNDSNWSNIEFLDKTRTDNKLAWPLGYMILQSASSPTEGLIWAVPLPLFICLIVLFVLLLALAVLFACIALRTSRGKRKGYKPF